LPSAAIEKVQVLEKIPQEKEGNSINKLYNFFSSKVISKRIKIKWLRYLFLFLIFFNNKVMIHHSISIAFFILFLSANFLTLVIFLLICFSLFFSFLFAFSFFISCFLNLLNFFCLFYFSRSCFSAFLHKILCTLSYKWKKKALEI